ncbi:hypothetical protein Nepgr_009045 [Nepenthes gracilis]|uniref:SPARK domain-containing protein n=1 Tax=Nepenthes gracilis TaxID=150966 RepID=A0AAD3S9S9_NEPGR|nr:hypothetical protein Nepgr_009045 [Nepenthes gracilis]
MVASKLLSQSHVTKGTVPKNMITNKVGTTIKTNQRHKSTGHSKGHALRRNNSTVRPKKLEIRMPRSPGPAPGLKRKRNTPQLEDRTAMEYVLNLAGPNRLKNICVVKASSDSFPQKAEYSKGLSLSLFDAQSEDLNSFAMDYWLAVVSVAMFHSLFTRHCSASVIAQPVTGRGLPLQPGDYATPSTVPALPVQPESLTCHLDLYAELFGGVHDACGHNLDRSRCCPVLAAWLFAAHARSALQVTPASSSSPSELPMIPDDSQKCVSSLQSALLKRDIKIPLPNASCDAVLCFCGIRLHQITSLSCPAAFNLTTTPSRKVTPTAAVKNLEKNCRNSSYAGCNRCLGALQTLNGEQKNGTGGGGDNSSSRVTKMFNRDCQLMGLTWLLARNKTTYIPTVSAVLRAIMYSEHPAHDSRCSPDQENMPLAVDSLQFAKADSSSGRLGGLHFFIPTFPVLPLILLLIYL